MRLARLILGCGFCLLAGCALFTPQVQISKLAPTASPAGLKSVAPGDCCRVTLLESKVGLIRRRTEYIGKIEQIAGDSIILSEVTTHVWSENPKIDNTPLLNRMMGIGWDDTPMSISLPLDRVAAIEWIPPDSVDLFKWGRVANSSKSQGAREQPSVQD